MTLQVASYPVVAITDPPWKHSRCGIEKQTGGFRGRAGNHYGAARLRVKLVRLEILDCGCLAMFVHYNSFGNRFGSKLTLLSGYGARDHSDRGCILGIYLARKSDAMRAGDAGGPSLVGD